MYSEINIEICQLYLDADKPQLALKHCQLALLQDNTQEHIYRLAMIACAVVGDWAELARFYELCQAMMLKEVDAPVSSETDKLYHTLMP